MPIFEYKCIRCNAKFEILHKSLTNQEEVICPECSSPEYKKLMSNFSSAKSAGSGFDNCTSGSCGIPQVGGCASGMCGLN